MIAIVAIAFLINHGFGLVKSQDRGVGSGLLSKEIKERIKQECNELHKVVISQIKNFT